MANKRPIDWTERNCIIMAAEMLDCYVEDVPPSIRQQLINIDDAVWSYHNGKGEVGSSQIVATVIELSGHREKAESDEKRT